MPSPLTLIALASVVTLTACASNPSMAPMAIARAVPQECRTPCPDPPSLALPREQWDGEVFAWGAECAALHADCVKASQ